MQANLADLSLSQLVELQQAMGVQADQLREQRTYLSKYIAQRRLQEPVNAAAPGVVVTSTAAV